jgi:hypothetical protein
MRKTILGVVASFAMVAAALACSSNSGGDGSAPCAESLFNSGGADCNSCAQANCSAQTSGFESSCSGFLSCICASGSYSASAANSSACTGTVESSCDSAVESLESCLEKSCSSECSYGDGGSGDGS